jgi:hypothetical protein
MNRFASLAVITESVMWADVISTAHELRKRCSDEYDASLKTKQ